MYSRTSVVAILVGLVGFFALACARRPLDTITSSTGGATFEDGTTRSPTLDDPGTNPTTEVQPTTLSGTIGSSTIGGTDNACSFGCETSDTGLGPCDVFAQDCPEGEKCVPYSEGGGIPWDAVKCVPLMGNVHPGGPCSAMDGGLDDCAEGAICGSTDGICIELCGGSPEAPTCKDPEKFICAFAGANVFSFCVRKCDLLLQDCADDELCLPFAGGAECVPDASGDAGQTFDFCKFVDECDKGLFCIEPASAKECAVKDGGCCLPFCDLSDPDVVCPGAGQLCESIYDGMAPPDHVNVGVCTLPK